MKYKRGGLWTRGTPKIRENGQWVPLSATDGTGDTGGTGGDGGPSDGGFTWDQTFTDTSWVSAAGDDLNVERVTTLDPTGSGSINEALNNASGPTVVVFEVGGVIDMRGEGDLDVGPDQVWIAGETAPDPGISVIGGGIVVDGSQVIVSHVGAFYGDQASDGEALKIYGNDVLFDHCSAFWGVDEVAGASDPVDRASFLNCIIAEGLFDGPHPEGEHSRGMLFNDTGDEICVLGCLFANNNRRHPMSRSDIVLANNYIYNGGWDGELIHFNGSAEKNVTSVGLYVEDGPDSQTGNAIHLYNATLYYDDIGQNGDHPIAASSIDVVDTPPIKPPGLDLASGVVASEDVPTWVMNRAGARPARRAPVESEFINNRVGGGQGGSVDSQNDVGGYPNYDPTTRTLDVPSTGLLEWLRGFTSDVETGA